MALAADHGDATLAGLVMMIPKRLRAHQLIGVAPGVVAIDQ
jgi:hypothetical protein